MPTIAIRTERSVAAALGLNRGAIIAMIAFCSKVSLKMAKLDAAWIAGQHVNQLLRERDKLEQERVRLRGKGKTLEAFDAAALERLSQEILKRESEAVTRKATEVLVPKSAPAPETPRFSDADTAILHHKRTLEQLFRGLALIHADELSHSGGFTPEKTIQMVMLFYIRNVSWARMLPNNIHQDLGPRKRVRLMMLDPSCPEGEKLNGSTKASSIPGSEAVLMRQDHLPDALHASILSADILSVVQESASRESRLPFHSEQSKRNTASIVMMTEYEAAKRLIGPELQQRLRTVRHLYGLEKIEDLREARRISSPELFEACSHLHKLFGQEPCSSPREAAVRMRVYMSCLWASTIAEKLGHTGDDISSVPFMNGLCESPGIADYETNHGKALAARAYSAWNREQPGARERVESDPRRAMVKRDYASILNHSLRYQDRDIQLNQDCTEDIVARRMDDQRPAVAAMEKISRSLEPLAEQIATFDSMDNAAQTACVNAVIEAVATHLPQAEAANKAPKNFWTEVLTFLALRLGRMTWKGVDGFEARGEGQALTSEALDPLTSRVIFVIQRDWRRQNPALSEVWNQAVRRLAHTQKIPSRSDPLHVREVDQAHLIVAHSSVAVEAMHTMRMNTKADINLLNEYYANARSMPPGQHLMEQAGQSYEFADYLPRDDSGFFVSKHRYGEPARYIHSESPISSTPETTMGPMAGRFIPEQHMLGYPFENLPPTRDPVLAQENQELRANLDTYNTQVQYVLWTALGNEAKQMLQRDDCLFVRDENGDLYLLSYDPLPQKMGEMPLQDDEVIARLWKQLGLAVPTDRPLPECRKLQTPEQKAASLFTSEPVSGSYTSEEAREPGNGDGHENSNGESADRGNRKEVIDRMKSMTDALLVRDIKATFSWDENGEMKTSENPLDVKTSPGHYVAVTTSVGIRFLVSNDGGKMTFAICGEEKDDGTFDHPPAQELVGNLHAKAIRERFNNPTDIRWRSEEQFLRSLLAILPKNGEKVSLSRVRQNALLSDAGFQDALRRDLKEIATNLGKQVAALTTKDIREVKSGSKIWHSMPPDQQVRAGTTVLDWFGNHLQIGEATAANTRGDVFALLRNAAFPEEPTLAPIPIEG